MAELNRISEQKIMLDIGGYKYSTSLQTLRAEPESMLGIMFSERHPITKQKDGSVFIDRDGTHFRIILNYLRGSITSSELLPDNNLLLSELLTEVNYYQLKGLEKIIKSEEKARAKIITQEEIFNVLYKDSDDYFYTTKSISFRNSNLNNLRFQNIIFKHSLDLSGSSLMNTTFQSCFFSRWGQYSFDCTDLHWCRFENCTAGNLNGFYKPWATDISKLIIDKRMTFHDAQNIDLASFDNENIRKLIKETYRL